MTGGGRGGGRDDPVRRLAALPPALREQVLRGLTLAQRRELNARWRYWAHDGQYAPPGDWRIWLIRAGRGFGKTRAGAEWVTALARADATLRIALVGATADDVRRVMIEGESGLIAVARADEPVRWRSSMGELDFASGATAHVYSARAPDKLRGPEHHAAWCDELAKWHHDTPTWDNLMLGLRLGVQPRAVITTTPRPTALLRHIMALPGVVETHGGTRDNPHLPPSYVSAVEAMYGGTQLGRQELDGELIDDIEGALWPRALIERCRIGSAPEVERVVIGVDPPAGTASGTGGDACGIVAVGLGRDDIGYVLEDASVATGAPEAWARAVAACASRHAADRIVAEVNNGGAMVESVLRAAGNGLPVKAVRASRGKAARAEPVAMLYEAGRVRHAGVFRTLEDELCGLRLGGAYAGPGRSPDRADALVWALSELMLKPRATARAQPL